MLSALCLIENKERFMDYDISDNCQTNNNESIGSMFVDLDQCYVRLI